MAYYNKCELCGANLDPGEHCDCDQPRYLTVSEIAQRWRVLPDLVYDILRSGSLTAMKFGGRVWRIPLASVEAYERKSMSGTTTGGLQKRPVNIPRKLVLEY